jgi:hypothetical protein
VVALNFIHMRVSKDLARQISFKLTDKGRAKVAKLKKEWENAVTIAYIQQIPERIIKTQALCPEWFRMTDTITLDGHGFSWINVSATERVIQDCKGNSYLKLDNKLASHLKGFQIAWQNAKDQNEKLQVETENAILALGTCKKVTEHFPQAANMLPTTAARCVALIPSLDGLTNKLKNQ